MDVKEKLNMFINDNLRNEGFFNFKKARHQVEKCCSCSENSLCDIDLDLEEKDFSVGNLSTFIEENKDENKFQRLLFKYIDDKGLKDSDVYNKVHIDRRLFSKIRSDAMYHPSKETIILLGLSLELNENELEELLLSASYSLPRNNIYDLIIRFCFIEGIYELKDVNELLDSYDCKCFSY